MPTNTLNHTDIVVHVPVDEFEIVNGPGAVMFLRIQSDLHRFPDEYPKAVLTLKTPASGRSFKRSIKFASIYHMNGDEISFTALFSGQIVSGIYNVRTRTGWFSLD